MVTGNAAMNQKEHATHGVLAQFGIGHHKSLAGVNRSGDVGLYKIGGQAMEFFRFALGELLAQQPIAALATRLHMDAQLLIGQHFVQAVAPLALELGFQCGQRLGQIEQHGGVTGHDP
jgi:hypothetical protein